MLSRYSSAMPRSDDVVGLDGVQRDPQRLGRQHEAEHAEHVARAPTSSAVGFGLDHQSHRRDLARLPLVASR